MSVPKASLHFIVKPTIIVDPIITYTLSIGSVRNARRMNQRYEGSPGGIPRSVYTAMHVASGRVRRKNRTYRGLEVCIYFWNSL